MPGPGGRVISGQLGGVKLAQAAKSLAGAAKQRGSPSRSMDASTHQGGMTMESAKSLARLAGYSLFGLVLLLAITGVLSF